MKKMLLMLVTVVGIAGISCGQGSRKSPHDTVSNAHVKVTYGRPAAKGRVVFGELEKYGKVWRTGADEATEITFMHDMDFAGKPVKAGTYTLFTIPTETNWTVILNSKLGEWGAYGYEKIKGQNVLEATVSSKKLSNVVEQLTITPTNTALVIAWDKTEVSIPMSMKM